MTAQSELVVPKLTTPGKVRVITVGAILPLLFAMSGWAVASSLDGLPDELPSHWSGTVADSFLPPEAIINAWSFGALFAAALAVSITIGAAQRWEWTPLGRGASAVGVGITGALTSGLVVPLLLAQGETTTEIVTQGAAPSVLSVMGGFALVTILAVLVLPRGGHPAPPSQENRDDRQQ
ncbi:hypothetical protein [Microbacterium lacticum]